MPEAPANDTNYLSIAADVARWIGTAAITTPHGLRWLPNPSDPTQSTTLSAPATIYSGSAGVVLFLLELAQATGNQSYLEAATQGADELVATWQDVLVFQSLLNIENFNLTFSFGVAGTAFVLAHAWQATQHPAYHAAALAITQHIIAAARPVGAGVAWVGATSAGLGDGAIVLYLLWAAEFFHDPALLALAAQAGKRIVEVAETDPRGGLKWVGFPLETIGMPAGSYMPNFEFGTAGVAYVLTRLYQATNDSTFLDAARQGAAHVQAIATQSGDGALLFYREPDLTDLYYLGYCHGPVGTARTFYALYQATNEPSYLDWTERFARGILQSGIPEQATPGLWNVICQCCGTTGILDFFVSLAITTQRETYLNFAIRVADQTLSRATIDEQGYRWAQAWTRVQPDFITTETGYMIGAAGEGSAFLHLHLALQQRYSAVLFPDNPFPRTS